MAFRLPAFVETTSIPNSMRLCCNVLHLAKVLSAPSIRLLSSHICFIRLSWKNILFCSCSCVASHFIVSRSSFVRSFFKPNWQTIRGGGGCCKRAILYYAAHNMKTHSPLPPMLPAKLFIFLHLQKKKNVASLRHAHVLL